LALSASTGLPLTGTGDDAGSDNASNGGTRSATVSETQIPRIMCLNGPRETPHPTNAR
jgi:hypothetical protein